MRGPLSEKAFLPAVPEGRPGRRSGTAVTAAALTMLTVFALPAPTASAEPKPSRKQLTAQQEKLSDQAEQLTEEYNGLRVRLKQAERAAAMAESNAERQEQNLRQVRAQVARLAADAFKAGGNDPVSSFLGSDDSQATLDRAATVDYLAKQNGAQVAQLLQAMQAAERARKQVEIRATEVRDLTEQNEKKQKQVKTLLTKVQKQLGQPTGPSAPGAAPNIDSAGASAKAMGAVRAALGVRGTPYSWGGGSASGPTYGVAQGANIKGFDCSGLTLYAYAQVGISLPHYTGSQFNAGAHVSLSQLKPGDLVFFYSDLHHMGMYIGNGQMVHAPQTGDVVKISPIAGRPFAGGVRIA